MNAKEKALLEAMDRKLLAMEELMGDLRTQADQARKAWSVLTELIDQIDKVYQMDKRGAFSQWLSAEQLAREIGKSKRTIQEWAKNGTIPAHRIGNSYRFKRSEL